jgi:hypothetical protein
MEQPGCDVWWSLRDFLRDDYVLRRMDTHISRKHIFSFAFGYAILSVYIATGFPSSLFDTFLF